MFKLSVLSNNSTFQLSSSVAAVDEGSVATITLTTTGVQNGFAVPYTISGDVDSDDLSGAPLVGNFIIDNGSAQLVLTIAEDQLTEGDESLTLTLDGLLTSVSLTVNDTSISVVSEIVETQTLQLKIVEANAKTNQMFVDSSLNNLTVTAVDAPSQSRFSPFSQAGFSLDFIGGSGYGIKTPNSNASLTFGTGNFTIEAWVMTNDVGSFAVYDGRDANNGAFPYLLNLGASNSWSWYVNGSAVISSPDATVPGRWYHVAVSRQGSSTRLFVNGVQKGSTWTDTTNYLGSATGTVIGANYIMATANGYISDFRIVKGTALYTSNFTAPTTRLTAVAGTSLLTANTRRIVDTSGNNMVLTVVGSAGGVKVAAVGPYTVPGYDPALHGGSIYFVTSGGNDVVYLANSANTQLSNDNFTIEFWVYPTDSSGWQTLFGRRVAGVAGGVNIYRDANGIIKMYLSNSSSTWDIASNVGTGVAPVFQWTHVALVRNGSAFALYVNGVASGTASSVLQLTNTSVEWSAGAARDASEPFNGYISNIRLVKGTAVYTSNFTLPTTPVSAITNTQILLNGISPAVYDVSGKAAVVTRGSYTSTTEKVYESSVYVPSGGNVTVLPEAVPHFATGDFTVEFWMKSMIAGDAGGYFNVFYMGAPSEYLFLRFGDAGFNNDLQYFFGNGTSFELIGRTSQTKSSMYNTWKHIAITRQGGVVRMFINGVVQTVARSGSVTGPTQTFTNSIGRGSFVVNGYIGYIEDLRITKGLARYVDNFTPAQLP